jgi:radical SAM superfamily enzyme YgiQ (UPF0313 family)
MNPRFRRILMVYPAFHKTHWGMKYSLPIIGKQSIMAPLGLITVAALTPKEYEIRLVDMNYEELTDADIEWCDMICLSAMMAQRESMFESAERAKAKNKLVVFGGPFPTASPEECTGHCDVMVLNEGEITWQPFLKDLEAGSWQKVYANEDKPDVTLTPVPRFDLLKTNDYLNIPIQFARGCPFECEFCDIPVMLGRKPRTKTTAQIIAELDAIYATGYRGGIMLVDDNFIGKKNEAKKLLPAVQKWNEAHGNPFYYSTQVTVTLSEDAELIQLMTDARFAGVFMGVETPSLASLKETNKYQNIRRSLLDSIKIVQSAGLFVYAGFIVGFDSDTEDIFDRQIEFIRQAAIPAPTLALLYALPGTPLHKRMAAAGRLRKSERSDDFSGYNTNFDTNIITVLPRRTLLEGYRKIIATCYDPKEFFYRAGEFFKRMPQQHKGWQGVMGFCFIMIGILTGKMGPHKRTGPTRPAQMSLLKVAWKNLSPQFKGHLRSFLWMLFKSRPDQLPAALVFTLVSIHYQRFTFEDLIPDVDRRLRLMSEAGPEPDGRLAPGPIAAGAVGAAA